jgi:hypothetical protein
MEQDKMSNHYRGPSINAFHQVSAHLAEIDQSETRIACGGHV